MSGLRRREINFQGFSRKSERLQPALRKTLSLEKGVEIGLTKPGDSCFEEEGKVGVEKVGREGGKAVHCVRGEGWSFGLGGRGMGM